MIAPNTHAQQMAQMTELLSDLHKAHNHLKEINVDLQERAAIAEAVVFKQHFEIQELKRLLDIERSNHCATFKQLEGLEDEIKRIKAVLEL